MNLSFHFEDPSLSEPMTAKGRKKSLTASVSTLSAMISNIWSTVKSPQILKSRIKRALWTLKRLRKSVKNCYCQSKTKVIFYSLMTFTQVKLWQNSSIISIQWDSMEDWKRQEFLIRSNRNNSLWWRLRPIWLTAMVICVSITTRKPKRKMRFIAFWLMSTRLMFKILMLWKLKILKSQLRRKLESWSRKSLFVWKCMRNSVSEWNRYLTYQQLIDILIGHINGGSVFFSSSWKCLCTILGKSIKESILRLISNDSDYPLFGIISSNIENIWSWIMIRFDKMAKSNKNSGRIWKWKSWASKKLAKVHHNHAQEDVLQRVSDVQVVMWRYRIENLIWPKKDEHYYCKSKKGSRDWKNWNWSENWKKSLKWKETWKLKTQSLINLWWGIQSQRRW